MSTEIVEKFVYPNSFYKSAYNELTKIEHLFFDLPMFILNVGCTLDLTLQRLAADQSAEQCLESITYLCKQPNLSKPVNIEEPFTYRLIADKLEMIKSSLSAISRVRTINLRQLIWLLKALMKNG